MNINAVLVFEVVKCFSFCCYTESGSPILDGMFLMRLSLKYLGLFKTMFQFGFSFWLLLLSAHSLIVDCIFEAYLLVSRLLALV